MVTYWCVQQCKSKLRRVVKTLLLKLGNGLTSVPKKTLSFGLSSLYSASYIVREATTIFVWTMLYWIKPLVYFQRFEGNINTYSAELRQVEPPIIGKRIRFIPYCRHPRTVCMRVEIYGCQWTGKSCKIPHHTLGHLLNNVYTDAKTREPCYWFLFAW